MPRNQVQRRRAGSIARQQAFSGERSGWEVWQRPQTRGLRQIDGFHEADEGDLRFNLRNWQTKSPADGGRFRFAKKAAARTITAMKPAQPAPAAETQKSAVLLIDDEKPLLDVFTTALEPFYEVTTATSAREAEFILHKKAFKVVVADHLMPGGNGMNFLVRAREEYPHMQRILVTGYMKPEMLMRSVNEAALFRYLLKPVSLPELLKVIQEAVKVHDTAAAATR
ncbi:response regulator [Opitutus terrae]|nr:response regulator [Opitutus terrae]